MIAYLAKDSENHDDDRGKLRAIQTNGNIKSALYCTGKSGSIRGSHVHKEDTHYCYVVKGTIRYEYKTSDTGEVLSVTLVPGDTVFTPVGEIHRFIFLTDGAFVALLTLPRTQEGYEHDITRKSF